VAPGLNDLKAIIDYCKSNEYFSSIKKIEKKVAAWADAFPIDILSEMKKANAYLVASGRRYRDYGNFLHRWLNRAAGPAIMRPPSMNELVKRLGDKLNIKRGLKKKVDLKERRKLLEKQAERLKREGR